jgi:hypothetical protein
VQRSGVHQLGQSNHRKRAPAKAAEQIVLGSQASANPRAGSGSHANYEGVMHQDDIERRLNNWARWYWSGGLLGPRSGGTTSSIYLQGPRGRRAGVSMPVIDGEAIDTSDAVDRLNVDLRNALRARYLRLGPRGGSLLGLIEKQVARRLGCSEDTYARRLSSAKRLLAVELAERRRRRPQPLSTPVSGGIKATDTGRI